MADQEQEGLLTSAARMVGHAAGRVAKVLGAEADGPTEAHGGAGKPPSRRAQRIQKATAAKESAAALSKSAVADNVRFRRTMGKPPSIWSEEDVEYVTGLLAKASNPA